MLGLLDGCSTCLLSLGTMQCWKEISSRDEFKRTSVLDISSAVADIALDTVRDLTFDEPAHKPRHTLATSRVMVSAAFSCCGHICRLLLLFCRWYPKKVHSAGGEVKAVLIPIVAMTNPF